jgi:hypothetical protein
LTEQALLKFLTITIDKRCALLILRPSLVPAPRTILLTNWTQGRCA